MALGTERALRAVSEYFPPQADPQHAAYATKARLQLAYLYEEADRWQEALRLYRELGQQESERNIQVIALIGEANASLATGSQARANQTLYRLAEVVRSRRPGHAAARASS